MPKISFHSVRQYRWESGIVPIVPLVLCHSEWCYWWPWIDVHLAVCGTVWTFIAWQTNVDKENTAAHCWVLFSGRRYHEEHLHYFGKGAGMLQRAIFGVCKVFEGVMVVAVGRWDWRPSGDRVLSCCARKRAANSIMSDDFRRAVVFQSMLNYVKSFGLQETHFLFIFSMWCSV